MVFFPGKRLILSVTLNCELVLRIIRITSLVEYLFRRMVSSLSTTMGFRTMRGDLLLDHIDVSSNTLSTSQTIYSVMLAFNPARGAYNT